MDANNDRTEAHKARVAALLDQMLPKEVPKLEKALREAEALYMGIVMARVDAQAVLNKKRMQYLHPKDKEYTDYDRKIMLEANTSELQAEYELLAGMEKGLEQRLAVIQTLLVQC